MEVFRMIFEKPEFLWSLLIYLTFVVLLYKGRLPSVQSFADFTNIFNSRGGNIFVLFSLSIWFFAIGMRFFYYTLHMVEQKQLTPDNAILMIAVNWITGSAFGGAFGALLKTMTGESSKARASDTNGAPKVDVAAPPSPQTTPTQVNGGVTNG